MYAYSKTLPNINQTCVCMYVPNSMEMMRQWSSSLTQTRAVCVSLWKMPRPLGQDRAAPDPVSMLRAVGTAKRNPVTKKKSMDGYEQRCYILYY